MVMGATGKGEERDMNGQYQVSTRVAEAGAAITFGEESQHSLEVFYPK